MCVHLQYFIIIWMFFLFVGKQQVSLAKEFEALVQGDARFQVTNDVLMGLVCFRLKASLSCHILHVYYAIYLLPYYY